MEFKNLGKIYPGMWRFPTNPDRCCIYRVPSCIRRVNPEAYTPQLLIIGPLHHSLKSQALKSLGDINNAKSMGYLNMEEHKKIYLMEFAKRVEREKTIDELRRMIEEHEDVIRESYSESTAWIQSPEFVDMILHDSVFITELMLRRKELLLRENKIGDPLMYELCLQNIIMKDLMLLENQLPYFILETLFDPIIQRVSQHKTFWELVITNFNFEDKIGNNSKFRHFTDLFRCVRVVTLPEHCVIGEFKSIEHMRNADKLYSGGLKFEAVEEDLSLEVSFVKGCLKIPRFWVHDDSEMTLRNIMALEQCHYPCEAHVCNYVIFLDYLIDTVKDVDLLVETGVIRNWIGEHCLVAEMVNKLGLGIFEFGSYYSDIAHKVNAHYSNRINRSKAILKRVYFGNLWTGTATVAATFLLLMTLIQTVASIIQVMQNHK